MIRAYGNCDICHKFEELEADDREDAIPMFYNQHGAEEGHMFVGTINLREQKKTETKKVFELPKAPPHGKKKPNIGR